MRTGTKINLFAGACVLAGFGLAVGCVKPAPGYNVTEREFICEIDGKLSERHVGVESVSQETYTTIAWRIYYDDGQLAFYHQMPGETCMLHEIPAPAQIGVQT